MAKRKQRRTKKAKRKQRRTRARRRRPATKALARVGGAPAAPGGVSGVMSIPDREVRHNIVLMATVKQHEQMIRGTLEAPTPPSDIKILPREAGKKAGVAYVSDDYVRRVLDAAFGRTGWRFSFDLACPWDLIAKNAWVIVKGRLEVITPAGWVHREQYGTGRVQFAKDSDKMNNPDIAFKGAATDAFKKCANMLGVAEDVYSGQHHKIRQEERRVEQAEQKQAQETAKTLGPEQAKVYNTVQKLIQQGMGTREQVLNAIAWLLPNKQWSAGVPTPRELTDEECKTIMGQFVPVMDGVGMFTDDGKIKAKP